MNKYLILFLGFLFAVALPILDVTMNFSESWSADTKFQITISLIIIVGTLLATYISVILEKISKREFEENNRHQSYHSAINQLTEAINGNNSLCFPLNKVQLYTKLNELVLNSTTKLELMYLGEKPPSKLEKFDIRDKHIKDLDTLITQERTTIKRVILYNSENKQWIKQIANKFKSKRFFSLYLIEASKAPSLSIQVIDSSKVVVINVLKNANVDKKHIFIESEKINRIYHGLYDDIIEKSIKIIENGTLDVANFDKYLK